MLKWPGHNGKPSNALAILDGAKKAGANAIGIHITSMEDYMVKIINVLLVKLSAIQKLILVIMFLKFLTRLT